MAIMKTNHLCFFIAAVLCGLSASGCGNPSDSGDYTEAVIYSNSFESLGDTVGWTGYGARQLRRDAPPGGRNQSLFISGGCIVPHAAFKIGEMVEDSRLVLRCWGKDLGSGGLACLGFSESPFSGTFAVTVIVEDSVWTLYRSDTLSCKAGSSLRLSFVAGGFVPSAMLVDNVEVVRLK